MSENDVVEQTEATQPEAQATPDVNEQVAAEKARADENYNKFLLAMADFENYKKRMERENERIVTEYRKRLLTKFLPVIDNLERALQFNSSGDDKLRGGIEATLRGFEAVLQHEGVKAIDVKGKAFDPHIAEAIGTTEHTELEDDMVAEVAEKGYTIGEELLRPAKVIVAKRG